MRAVLHILTRPADELVNALFESQRQSPDTQVTLADLTVPEPDYDKLLEQIFSNDSIEVW